MGNLVRWLLSLAALVFSMLLGGLIGIMSDLFIDPNADGIPLVCQIIAIVMFGVLFITSLTVIWGTDVIS